MERAISMIGALGRDEVQSMLDEDNGAVMSCGFCSEIYQLNGETLKEILAAEMRHEFTDRPDYIRNS
jgi:Disulfide bond chaperones of the HSP33 family